MQRNRVAQRLLSSWPPRVQLDNPRNPPKYVDRFLAPSPVLDMGTSKDFREQADNTARHSQ